jgi:hypothetical protein
MVEHPSFRVTGMKSGKGKNIILSLDEFKSVGIENLILLN